MDNIHDYHGTLRADEAERLNDDAETQEQIILQILRANPDKSFAYFDIVELTGYDQDSAKRSLSNLSGSAKHDRYLDELKQWPAAYHKDKDKRKKNPRTGATCGTYQYNSAWGKATPQSELFAPSKPRHSGIYSGEGA